MAGKFSIRDGQGKEIDACVKKLPNGEQSLCVNLSGLSPQTALTVIPFASGGQTDISFTLDGDGSTKDTAVDGSVTAKEFRVNPLVGLDFIVAEISFVCSDNGIKINNFLGQNSALTTGCDLFVQADNKTTNFDTIKKTADFCAFTSIAGFDLVSEAAGDLCKALRVFNPQFIIRAQNTFGITDAAQDKITWTVNDDLRNIFEIVVQARGFTTLPGVL